MANHLDKIIGKNLQVLRQKQGFAHDHIADFLEITSNELSDFEKGNRPIPTALMSLLANLYGVDKYDLYTENLGSDSTIPNFNFRGDSIPVSDLKQIASFKKIIRNYLNMKALMEGRQH